MVAGRGGARVRYRLWIRAAGVAVASVLAASVQAQDPGEPSYALIPAPSLNFYGSPGLIDMPSAEMLPDGSLTTGVSYFGGQTRITATFQALPWLSASFRYNGIQNWNLGGFQTYYDRGFDVRFRLLKESKRWPAITIGLQDFIGTGIYAGEYVVATKNFTLPGWNASRVPGRLKISAGVGWGRLGSNNSFGSPFSTTRPTFQVDSTGGQVAYDQWFRGPAAFFGGLEYLPNDRLGLKLEYSSDAYVIETQTTSVFERDSSLNFGLEYKVSNRTTLGAYYAYGSEFGVTLQFQMDPHNPPGLITGPAPLPVEQRPPRVENPLAYSTDWIKSAAAPQQVRAVVEQVLKRDGLALEHLVVGTDSVELRFRNLRYRSNTIAIGRAARVLAQVLPASVETFRLVPVVGGLGASAATIRRSDLEALEFQPDASEALWAVTAIGEAGPVPSDALPTPDLYPNFRWSLGPFFAPSYFDPDQPVRMDFGLQLSAGYEIAPGWLLAGSIRHRLVGNVKDGRLSNSILPRVRTDQTLYAQEQTTLHRLYLSHQWQPGENLYARVTAGYLEKMFGGISTELLWKPVNSRLGLGIEANYVRQREYEQRLGFRDYSILTGHASAYMELGGGFLGQIDVGRYLAGDLGATFNLSRTFNNGWSVGGFFSLTDVSSADFGEGSFDKGIYFTIPVNWFLGQPSRQTVGLGIRPVQRDGGQRLEVPNRLYGQVRNAHAKALRGQWSRVWE